jgi:hypothetical protein
MIQPASTSGDSSSSSTKRKRRQVPCSSATAPLPPPTECQQLAWQPMRSLWHRKQCRKQRSVVGPATYAISRTTVTGQAKVGSNVEAASHVTCKGRDQANARKQFCHGFVCDADGWLQTQRTATQIILTEAENCVAFVCCVTLRIR